NPDNSRKTDSTRRIRIENRAPQAGKTRLRLTVGGTRRAATGTPTCKQRTLGAPPVTACAPCRWPAPRFSCDRDGLLRRFSPRMRRVAPSVHEQSGLSGARNEAEWPNHGTVNVHVRRDATAKVEQ